MNETKPYLLAALPLALLACSQAPQPWRPPPNPDAGPVVTSAMDLPCDVADLLATRCVPCHADPPQGASESLTSQAALSAPSLSDPTKTVAEMAVILMQSDTDPMPPAPAAPGTPDEIAVLQAWVDGGMPAGMCGVDNPYDTPTTCSQGTHWSGGNRESTRMRPGGTCIDCHTRTEGPFFTAAGTVYASAHEPDDCNGGAVEGGSPVVEITDATGRVVQLDTNSVGNFYTQTRLTMPYTARVLYQGRSRAMVTAQDDGDCNGCHTESGTEGAPGRIMLP